MNFRPSASISCQWEEADNTSQRSAPAGESHSFCVVHAVGCLGHTRTRTTHVLARAQIHTRACMHLQAYQCSPRLDICLYRAIGGEEWRGRHQRLAYCRGRPAPTVSAASSHSRPQPPVLYLLQLRGSFDPPSCHNRNSCPHITAPGREAADPNPFGVEHMSGIHPGNWGRISIIRTIILTVSI